MIRSHRVYLGALELEHIPLLTRWRNDPMVIAYFGRYQPISFLENQRWYERQLDDKSVRNFIVNSDDKPIGWCGLENIDSQHGQAEVFLLIGERDYWGKGLGCEILSALLGFGFNELNLHRIYAYMLEPNKKAIRCFEKCGFTREGIAREAVFRHGEYLNMIWMSMIRREFLERTENTIGRESLVTQEVSPHLPEPES